MRVPYHGRPSTRSWQMIGDACDQANYRCQVRTLDTSDVEALLVDLVQAMRVVPIRARADWEAVYGAVLGCSGASYGYRAYSTELRVCWVGTAMEVSIVRSLARHKVPPWRIYPPDPILGPLAKIIQRSL